MSIPTSSSGHEPTADDLVVSAALARRAKSLATAISDFGATKTGRPAKRCRELAADLRKFSKLTRTISDNARREAP